MDALPLPPEPDLARYRALAADEEALEAWARGLPRATPFVAASIERALAALKQPGDRELLLARAHGFASWDAFAKLISDPDPFEDAADAVVGGDLAALQRLLDARPELIHARSSRIHHATLLHYVAANGVEDYRQLTPPNAVAIATALLDAGAEVDAIADTYDGGHEQTTMNLLVSSTHPAVAGLQSALVEVLLDHGAAIDGLDDDGSPLTTALLFWYGGAAETLARRGARVDTVEAAAAVGDEALVRRLAPGQPLGVALVWAIKFKWPAIVEFLLDAGADVHTGDPDGMTPLHWAAANGELELIDELLRRGARLDARNQWGGTVYSSTEYFAEHIPRDGVDYSSVLRHLAARRTFR